MARYTITDGPSKWDSAVSLIHGRSSCRDAVDFFVKEEPNRTFHVVINGLDREDGSGENWLFRGQAGSLPCHGYFSTQRRKGWIEIGTPSATETTGDRKANTLMRIARAMFFVSCWQSGESRRVNLTSNFLEAAKRVHQAGDERSLGEAIKDAEEKIAIVKENN